MRTEAAVNKDQSAARAVEEAASDDALLFKHCDFPEAPSHPLPGDPGRFGNTYLRFTVLYAFLVVAIATMPLWLSGIAPRAVATVNAVVALLFAFIWLVVALNATLNYRRLNSTPLAPWNSSKALRSRRFKHITIVPCYLDPLEILHDCMNSLAAQENLQDLVVVLTVEAKTPELEMKLESVRSTFRGVFGDLLLLVHRLKPDTEIPGGCSNKNFALREAYKYCTATHVDKQGRAIPYHYTITTCDTDSKFHPQYFRVLEAAYNAENPVDGQPIKMCVWQPPLFYNWNLDERPFFNRVTCIMRSTMMLGGLISFNLNPMSIFSYPLELGLKSGFINPRYGVDDIIAKVRWMVHTNSMVPVKMLGCAVISGPTVGVTMWEEAHEWGRQIRRWIVGSSESFHYFVIHWRGSPFFAGIAWFAMFFTYYGVLLCASGIFCVLASIPYPWVHYPTLPMGRLGDVSIIYAGALATALQLVAFAIAFGLDAVGARMLCVEERVNPIRNVLHWISSPLVLLVYSLIAFVSIVRFVFEGKAMARHDMAGKNGLQSAPASPTAAAEPGHTERTALVQHSRRESDVESSHSLFNVQQQC